MNKKKTCFITGANSGIGKAAAIQIAQAGYRVLVGARDHRRGTDAVREIREAANTQDVELLLIDLSEKDSVYRAVDQLIHTVDSLDVLIHNAADFDITRKTAEKNSDGIEKVWMTNHLGPLLLTKLLLPLLEKSTQGRILTVASRGLTFQPKLEVNLTDPEFEQAKYNVAKAYYQSKLAQVMYTYWLADELKDSAMTVNCIRVTNVQIDISRYPDLGWFAKFLYSIKSMFSISPEQMAKTYTYLATSPAVATVSGKYFNERNEIVVSSPYSVATTNIGKVIELSFSYFAKLKRSEVL